MTRKHVLVWDLPLRLFHWLLVAALAGSWITAEAGVEWMVWHFRLGYFAAGLVIFRIIWGFVGPRHARFKNFIRAPGVIIAYARTLFGRESHAHVGHNPVGALMVIVLLAAVSFQIGTGLFATDDIFTMGPFFPLVDAETADQLTSLHHLNFTVLQILAAVHVVAILFYLFWKRQSLILPMVRGTKPREKVAEGEEIDSSRFVLGLVVAALATAVVVVAVYMAPEPTEMEDDFY